MSSSCLSSLPGAIDTAPALPLENVSPQPRRGSCQKIGDFLKNFLFFTGLRSGESLKTIWNWQVSLVSHSQLKFLTPQQVPHLGESQIREIALDEYSTLKQHLSAKQLLKILAGSDGKDGAKIKALIGDRKLDIDDVRAAAMEAKWKNTEDNYKDNDPYQFLCDKDVKELRPYDFWRLTPRQIKLLTELQLRWINNIHLDLSSVSKSISYNSLTYYALDICQHLTPDQKKFILHDSWNSLYNQDKNFDKFKVLFPDMKGSEVVECLKHVRRKPDRELLEIHPECVVLLSDTVGDVPKLCYPFLKLYTDINMRDEVKDADEDEYEGKVGMEPYRHTFDEHKWKWDLIWANGKEGVTESQYAIALHKQWIEEKDVPKCKKDEVNIRLQRLESCVRSQRKIFLDNFRRH